MLAFKFLHADIRDGIKYKAYEFLDPANTDRYGFVRCEMNVPDLTLNELRRKTGVEDIYAILEFSSWVNYLKYYNAHRQELIELDEQLKNDPATQKDIAEHRKDMKAFNMWKAARKWEV